MKVLTTLVTYLTLTGSAIASTPAATNVDDWRSWTSVGQAQLTMFFFDIYESQLLSPNGDYVVDQDITPHPLALSITYQRDISQKQLLDATVEQWDKLGYKQSTTQAWYSRLQAIFPDIEEGNNLTYVTDGRKGQFYYSNPQAEQRMIGSIEEEAFNDAFLAIWLSPDTEYPRLRQRLIGSN
ncbi:chalcone isomerase family protein [Vibrio sp. M260118]|uniref:chalcone isomerase family protein n=1 Tax=Vibrio sp. M260118 TaxID=3020896 RepID=UPI002F3F76AE